MNWLQDFPSMEGNYRDVQPLNGRIIGGIESTQSDYVMVIDTDCSQYTNIISMEDCKNAQM